MTEKYLKKVDSNVAHVGRNHPDYRLDVHDWDAGHGDPHVWALPAVVSGEFRF